MAAALAGGGGGDTETRERSVASTGFMTVRESHCVAGFVIAE